MKKRFLSLIVLTVIAVTALFGCAGLGNTSSSVEEKKEIPDYAAQVTLDLTSAETKKLTVNMDEYTHIDGDTTHFRKLDVTNSSSEIPDTVKKFGIFKARYLAVNTPESTGTIEPWGKAASRFTKTALAGATSIILESEGPNWTTDSNGRFLTWIWYKTADSDTYRNLNVELLQSGLALASNATGSRYGAVAMDATLAAQDNKLYVFSDDADPEYYVGEAIQTDLKTVRTHLDYFSGKRVAITATVTMAAGTGTIYIEDYDQVEESTGLYYGMTVFYGMDHISWSKILAPGNKVFLVGEVSYSEGYGYQICNLKYNPYRDDPENIRIVEENSSATYKETTLTEFFGKTTIQEKVYDEETDKFKYDEELEEWITQEKTYDYAELAVGTSLSVSGLRVTDVYTTKNSENNTGAMSITCVDDAGHSIVVRTAVLYDDNGNLVTEDRFPVGTILTAKGIVDYYLDSYNPDKLPYQIKVFDVDNLIIQSN